MVSFQCEACGDILTKKKLDPHRNRCRGASFTCIDCMVNFHGVDYRNHTSCMTEDQKYQGALYKGPKTKGNQNGNKHKNQPTPNSSNMHATPLPPPINTSFDRFEDYVSKSDDRESSVEAPNEVPTPTASNNLDVFDYYVGSTPSASNLDFPRKPEAITGKEVVVRDEDSDSDDEGEPATPITPSLPPARRRASTSAACTSGAVVLYEAPSADSPVTTTSGKEDTTKKQKHSSKSDKSDKKRKRHDSSATEIPRGVLHSELTGPIDKLMRPEMAAHESASPDTTPPKKKKHSKSKSKDGIFSFLSSGSNGNSKTLPKGTSASAKPRKVSSSGRKASPPTRARSRSPAAGSRGKHSDSKKYHSSSTDDESDRDVPKKAASNEIVVYKTPTEMFFNIAGSADPLHGYSMDKIIKRVTRQQKDLDQDIDPKKLLKGIRVRMNDRGEYVLFSDE